MHFQTWSGLRNQNQENGRQSIQALWMEQGQLDRGRVLYGHVMQTDKIRV